MDGRFDADRARRTLVRRDGAGPQPAAPRAVLLRLSTRAAARRAEHPTTRAAGESSAERLPGCSSRLYPVLSCSNLRGPQPEDYRKAFAGASFREADIDEGCRGILPPLYEPLLTRPLTTLFNHTAPRQALYQSMMEDIEVGYWPRGAAHNRATSAGLRKINRTLTS